MLRRFIRRIRSEREIDFQAVQLQSAPEQPNEPHYLDSPNIDPELLPPVPHNGLKVNVVYGRITGLENVELITVEMDCPYRCGFNITHADALQDVAFMGAELLVRSHVKYHCVRAPQDIKDSINAARR